MAPDVLRGIVHTELTWICVPYVGLCLVMGAIWIYFWRHPIHTAVEQVARRDDRRTRFAIQLPFLIVTVAIVATYLIQPRLLLDETLSPTLGYSAFQIAVPCIYIAATVAYTMGRALREENPIERRSHLYVGLFPLMVVAGGLLQILVLPDTPVELQIWKMEEGKAYFRFVNKTTGKKILDRGEFEWK